MRRFEDGVAGDVIDVAAGRDADAADLRGERVAEVIAVEIQRGDDIEIRRAREHLLQRDVGDGVLDRRCPAPRLLPFAGFLHHRSAVDFLPRRRYCFADLIAPVAERAFGELHDVALVHERHALALELDRVADRAVDQPHAADCSSPA